MSNDLLCWGDNTAGQLRSAVTSSSLPIPVVCGAGEACKFQSVSAGAERTCAVDTDGKLWCWGTTGDNATGDRGTNTSRYDGEIQAADLNGNKILFTTVDLDLMDGCALSTGRELYCWHGAPSSLTDHEIHKKGTLYRSISVGKRHFCAQTTGFKLECFGDNTDGQITGNLPGFPRTISPELDQIFKRGGHVPAAGAMNSCAQDPDDNTICWGSPTRLQLPAQETGGFIALWRSYATSLSTNTDVCEFGVGNFFACTRTCATALGGDLFCGNWGGPRPPQLTMVPDPASDHYVSWSQVDVGPGHVCAVDFQRDIWCFGMNDSGQLGQAASSNTRTTVPTTPVSRFPNGIATLLIP